MTRPDAYLGLDVGGTGAKAGVFDLRGRLLGLGREAYAPTQTPDGRTEIPIRVIEDAARRAARTALAEARARIRAVSIASQGQTFVSLDRAGEPLHPAILWYDSRAAEQAPRFNSARRAAAPGDALPDAGAIATAPKIMWLRDHHPALMARAALHLLLPDYFAFRLAGIAATDPNTAESTGLYTSAQPDYSPAALRAAGIARDSLAAVLPAGTVVGPIRPESAAEWGLESDALFVTGTNDQYAGAMGAGNCRPGIVTETTGTCLALVTLAERLPAPLPTGLFGGRFPIPPLCFLLAFSKTAGVVLDWFRDRFAAGASAADMDREAQTSPPGANGLAMLPHFDGTVSPAPRPGARGAFAFVSLSHTRADFYRATLEALAFSLRECLEHLAAAGFPAGVLRSIGGGARSDFWLQMKADITGLAVEKPAVTEAAVLGAAMLAAYGVREFASLAEASQAFYARDRVFEPDPVRRAAYAEPFARHGRLMAALYGSP